MRHLVALVTATAWLAVSATAADVNGKWKGAMPSRDGNAREVSFQFKAAGANLTGNFIGSMGREIEIKDGKVTGDSISFSLSLEFNGNMVKVNYTGKFSGDDLNMKMQREGAPRSVEFTLKRAGA
jgi:hypothetical protein